MRGQTKKGGRNAFHRQRHPQLRIDGASAVKKITIEVFESDIEDVREAIEDEKRSQRAAMGALLTTPSEKEIARRKEQAMDRVLAQFSQEPK